MEWRQQRRVDKGPRRRAPRNQVVETRHARARQRPFQNDRPDPSLSRRCRRHRLALQRVRPRAPSRGAGRGRRNPLRAAHLRRRHDHAGAGRRAIRLRRADDAARRYGRGRDPDLLPVRRGCGGALRQGQGGGRRDRARHRGGGRPRLLVPRSGRAHLELRHLRSVEAPGRQSRRARRGGARRRRARGRWGDGRSGRRWRWACSSSWRPRP